MSRATRSPRAHRWRMLNFAGVSVAAGMRAVPRRYRFRAAIVFARAAEPFIRKTEAYRLQARIGVDGPAEIALHFVLQALTNNGIRYDPIFAVSGYDDFLRSVAGPKGILLAAPHAALLLLLLRRFHEDGLDVVSVSADPHMRVPGTHLVARTVQPSPALLLNVRTRLRRGGVTCVMLDRLEHDERQRTRELDTVNGTLIFVPALLELAARCGARVGFLEAHVERGRVAASIVMSSSDSADDSTREYMEFVREYVAARARTATRPATASPRGELEGAER